VNAPVERFLGLGIDIPLAHQTAKRGLDVVSGASKAIVQIEVAESGVEVVAPEQVDHTAAQPDTFRIAGRTAQSLGGFGDLVDLFLAFFVLGSGLGCRLGRRLGRLATALGESRARETEGCQEKHGKELTQRSHKRYPASVDFKPPARSPASSCDWIGTLLRRPWRPGLDHSDYIFEASVQFIVFVRLRFSFLFIAATS
jgi:hypothetical protein